MMSLLFYAPLFSYEVKEWDRKKKALLSRINRSEFGYYGLNDFQTDRHSKKKQWYHRSKDAGIIRTFGGYHAVLV